MAADVGPGDTLEELVSPLTRSVLAKAKVGGFVLAAVVLGTGTAQAVVSLPSSDAADEPVSVVDDGTQDPTDTDGTVDDGTVDDGTVDDGTVDDGTVDDGTVDPCADPSDTDGTVDDGTDEPGVDPCDPADTDQGTDEGTEDGTPDVTEADLACALAVNHGAYVSWVAHTTPSGPGHGAAVSEAAHSDCGKKGAIVPDTSGTEDDAAASTAVVDSGQAKAHGNGNGHGYGHTKDKHATGAAATGHGKPDHAGSGSSGHGNGYGRSQEKIKDKTHGPKK